MSLLRKQAPATIGIFLPNWLGDCVMATPTLRAIRKHFGSQARIAGVLRPSLANLFAGTGLLDEEWYFDPRRKSAQFGHRAIVRKIQSARLDLAILMPNSPRCAWLAWLGGATERIGYARNLRGPLLTGKLYRPKSGGRPLDQPMVDYYLRLADAVGCPAESRHLELAVTDADRAAADRVWADLGLRADGRVIAFNSSGAYGGAKLWPSNHFAKLAQHVVDRLDHDVVVLCGPQERDISRQIARTADRRRVFSLADQELGLPTTKGCLARCRLAVSTDSGPRHVAAALGKPVLTLMGPTSPVWIENPTVQGEFLRAETDCLGCARRVCPYGHHRCMEELLPEKVFEHVSAALARQVRIKVA